MTLSMPSISAGGAATRSVGQPMAEGMATTAAPFLTEFMACLTQSDAAAEPDAPGTASIMQTLSDTPVLTQEGRSAASGMTAVVGAVPASDAPIPPMPILPMPMSALSMSALPPSVLSPSALSLAAPPATPHPATPQPVMSPPDVALPGTPPLATTLPVVTEPDAPALAPAETATPLPPAATDLTSSGPITADGGAASSGPLEIGGQMTSGPAGGAGGDTMQPVTDDPSADQLEPEDALPMMAEDTLPKPPSAEMIAAHPAAAPEAAPNQPRKGAAKAVAGEVPVEAGTAAATPLRADAAAQVAAPGSALPLVSPAVATPAAVAATADPMPVTAPSAPQVGAAHQAAPAQELTAKFSPAAKSLGGEGRGNAAAALHMPDAPVPNAPAATTDAPAAPVTDAAVDPAASTPAPSATATTSAPPPVVMTDRADWPQTVVSATLAELTPDGGTMTLELAPEELGALRIVLTLEGDSASVQIQTETPEAARLLNEAQRHLAQDFARQGVTLASHDAQSGRRDEQATSGANRGTAGPDQDTSTDLAAPMRLTGTINLIA